MIHLENGAVEPRKLKKLLLMLLGQLKGSDTIAAHGGSLEMFY